MGGRDHSETCEDCGMQRGGLNNYVCNCEIAAQDRAEGKCSCRARMAGECMCGAWDDAERAEKDHLSSRLATVTADNERLARERDNYQSRLAHAEQAMADLADDICGLQPTESFDESIARISREDFKNRQGYVIIRAEVERMRPVYAAAIAWREAKYPASRSWKAPGDDGALVSVIDSALSTTSPRKQGE